MKKRIFLTLAFLLVLSALLSACGNTELEETTAATTVQTTDVTTETTEPAQTGYAHGEVQLTTIFIEDKLYQPNMNHWATFEKGEKAIADKKLELYGNVLSENNAAYPDTHLEASRLDVGTPIYRDGEGKFYYLRSDGWLFTLKTADSSRVPGARP